MSSLSNYQDLFKRIKEIITSYDPNAKVYVFGSLVRGKFTAASDIDILVITERIDMKYKMMVSVYSKIKEPVELHITTKEIFERWYKRFVPENELVEIA